MHKILKIFLLFSDAGGEIERGKKREDERKKEITGTCVQHNVYLVMERWVGSRPVDRLSVNLGLATCLSGSPEYRDNTLIQPTVQHITDNLMKHCY